MNAPAPRPHPSCTLPIHGHRADLVVIDLLGALCPERDRVRSCLAMALSNADLPAHPRDVASIAFLPARVGLERWITSTTALGPDVVRPLVDAVRHDYRERLIASLRASKEVQTHPGAATLLAELGAHGLGVAIDTELDGDAAAALLHAANLSGRGWIDAVVGADEVAAPRPGPGQIEEAVRRCGHRPGAAVVKVAGSPIDAQAALRAGCATILSLVPDLVVGQEPVSDLGELAEQLLGHPII